MPTIPQRISSAFAVLCGQYGDVTRMAKDREQSRQSLYRAQAEGVSLGVARRLLQVMTGPGRGRAVATLGRATLEAGRKAGPLLRVLDEAARPEVKQAAADEIFLAAGPS